jgi:hypothetical protein
MQSFNQAKKLSFLAIYLQEVFLSLDVKNLRWEFVQAFKYALK